MQATGLVNDMPGDAALSARAAHSTANAVDRLSDSSMQHAAAAAGSEDHLSSDAAAATEEGVNTRKMDGAALPRKPRPVELYVQKHRQQVRPHSESMLQVYIVALYISCGMRCKYCARLGFRHAACLLCMVHQLDLGFHLLSLPFMFEPWLFFVQNTLLRHEMQAKKDHPELAAKDIKSLLSDKYKALDKDEKKQYQG